MNKLKLLACLTLFAALILPGCGPDIPSYKKKLLIDPKPEKGVVFDRYEDALFGLDTADFQEGLKSIQQQYLPFLEGDLDDPDAVRYLRSFATDPFNVGLYQKVKQVFPNLDRISAIVEGVYRHFHFYYPDISLPTHVYTCVSGVDPEMPPVLFVGDALVISLDWYLDNDVVYEQMGMPQYRARRTMVETVAKDLGQLLYETYLDKADKQGCLLEEMVAAGRMDYFIEAMYPEIADSVLLGYSSAQTYWIEANEGNLWADMVGNQYLYSTDLEMYRIFLSDGPFTNEYSHEAPPRLGEYVGLQIVRSFMDTHETSLQELMQINDLQGLFLDSRYKPKK
jgi:hypothetical protein